MSCRLQPLPFALGLLAAPALAQVPDGCYVTSHFTHPSTTGPGGLWLHHPRGSVPSISVTGLPPELIGTATTPGGSGSSSVEILPDGRLLVGEQAGAGAPVHAWVLTLSGSAVVASQTQKIFLGNAAPGGPGHVNESSLVGPNQAVLAVGRLVAGPLAGQALGLVTWSASGGTVTPITMSPPPLGNYANAVAYANGRVYVGTFDSTTTPQTTRIYWVPLAGGTSTLLATFAGTIVNMQFDRDGNLVVQANGMRVLDPLTGKLLCFSQQGGNSFAIERATGKWTITTNLTDVLLMEPCPSSGLQTVATPPANGWGALTGIDVAPDRLHYGTTSGVVAAPWQLVPQANGLPLVGNTGFALSVAAPVAPGVWFLSGGRRSIPWGNLTIWIDLATLLPMGPVPTGGWIPFPIPNDTTLRNTWLFAQCLFLTTNGLAASDGLRLTLL